MFLGKYTYCVGKISTTELVCSEIMGNSELLCFSSRRYSWSSMGLHENLPSS